MEVQYWICGQQFSCVVRVVKKFCMLYYNFQFSRNAFSRNIKKFVSGFPGPLSPVFLYVCLWLSCMSVFPLPISLVFLYICLRFSCLLFVCISVFGFPVLGFSAFLSPAFLCIASPVFLYICVRFSFTSVSGFHVFLSYHEHWLLFIRRKKSFVNCY